MVGLLYLLVCLLLENGYAENGSSILLRLPDILQHMCPGAKVCRENQTLQAPMEVSEPGFESCCADCSCSFDCAETENCCFPSQQPQRNASGNQNDILQTTERSCLFLTTVPPPPEDYAFFQAYNMISIVSEPDSSANSTMQSNISCGDQRVAPWDSLYPVYSKRNNLLYKNAICATKNGAMDVTPFDAFLVCKEIDQLVSDASNFVQLLDSTSNSVPRDCSVDFTYRGDINDLKSHKCYKELVNVCLASKSFHLTYDIGFSKEEVISACTSGLVSPYRKAKMYANIFCYICNAEPFIKDISCKKITFERGHGSNGFTGLIDTNFITNDREDMLAKAKKVPKACEINDVSISSTISEQSSPYGEHYSVGSTHCIVNTNQ
ncbi:uncharacterized protein LOC128546710 [Mercenaria mercenaria]|uniref:uncharacterized protein LOC128546710 n=1 Tax=Mercenaria mercenaria TaxID=6596 RepID=UPI00234E54E7|nr:uncharacterized protein LOC128546710 [Mercenaria mercenaria]